MWLVSCDGLMLGRVGWFSTWFFRLLVRKRRSEIEDMSKFCVGKSALFATNRAVINSVHDSNRSCGLTDKA